MLQHTEPVTTLLVPLKVQLHLQRNTDNNEQLRSYWKCTVVKWCECKQSEQRRRAGCELERSSLYNQPGWTQTRAAGSGRQTQACFTVDQHEWTLQTEQASRFRSLSQPDSLQPIDSVEKGQNYMKDTLKRAKSSSERGERQALIRCVLLAPAIFPSPRCSRLARGGWKWQEKR
ncbi:hypothetical protein MHYP_G00338510 [Metynnis hypsauchen]